jgi:1,2-diacylglycerol 3-alpha-glucosyltransferase
VRVLWITPGFASEENDLNCIPPMQLLAQELLLQGVDLQIVTLEYPFRSEPYRWHGATVFPCNGQNRRWLKGRTLWRAMRFCREILDTAPGRKVTVHSFWLGWASGLGERLSLRHDVPHLTTLMGQDVLPQNRKFMYGLNAGRTARFVAVSDFQNDVFEKNTGLRAAQVIPWGVVESEIPAGFTSEKTLDVLGAGSLVPVKNWEKWLRVIALAVRDAPGLRAELVGDGVERANLERLARQLGLEENVHFAGSLPRPEVLTKMQGAKILLHTAHYESFGYVLAEAAMNACRVAGTPVGAMAQFGKTAGSDSDLAALVVDALGQPVQNQPFVPFTMRQTAEEYLKVYKGL